RRLAAELRPPPQPVEEGVQVRRDERQMGIADVERLHVDDLVLRPDVADELERQAPGQLEERGLDRQAWIALDAADVLDVPRLTRRRLALEQEGVELDRPVEIGHGVPEVIDGRQVLRHPTSLTVTVRSRSAERPPRSPATTRTGRSGRRRARNGARRAPGSAPPATARRSPPAPELRRRGSARSRDARRP